MTKMAVSKANIALTHSPQLRAEGYHHVHLLFLNSAQLTLH
jgi:hypothetical protein